MGQVYCNFSLAFHLGNHKFWRRPRYLWLGDAESGHGEVRLGVELAYGVDTLAGDTINFVMMVRAGLIAEFNYSAFVPTSENTASFACHDMSASTSRFSEASRRLVRRASIRDWIAS